ncbi:MAG: flagella accessory protein C [Candidatus Thermoplasmatota archaeon]
MDEEKKEEKKQSTEQEKTENQPSPDPNAGGNLEQRRAILQNMKDFDFQIKKNQENIDNVNTKINEMSKDLDDLVSLYEIVSEQMNPFVGLSKVTKKRLDALENFTREIDELKARMDELETKAHRGHLQKMQNRKSKPEKQNINDNNQEESKENIPETTQMADDEETFSQHLKDLSDSDIDKIIENSLSEINPNYQKTDSIDRLIDQYIKNLR